MSHTGHSEISAFGFAKLVAGDGHTRALKKSDDTLTCWGSNTLGQATAHAGDASHRWVYVSAGMSFNCGLTMEGNFYCWGSNSFGQTTIPATFPGL